MRSRSMRRRRMRRSSKRSGSGFSGCSETFRGNVVEMLPASPAAAGEMYGNGKLWFSSGAMMPGIRSLLFKSLPFISFLLVLSQLHFQYLSLTGPYAQACNHHSQEIFPISSFRLRACLPESVGHRYGDRQHFHYISLRAKHKCPSPGPAAQLEPPFPHFASGR